MNRARWLAPLLLILASPAVAQVPAAPAEVKRAFLALIDRPKVPLDASYGGGGNQGFEAGSGTFASEQKADGTFERVPFRFMTMRDPNAKKRKGEKKRPAVILLHGTGGNQDGMVPWLTELANRGFFAIAIDGRYHGNRAGGAKGADAYNAAIVRAWRSKPGEPQEHPFYYDTCWDVMRTIDFLQTRHDVDPDRIGLLGISKGGIETWLTGAVDDRVKVAIPAIGVQSFRWGLDHDRYHARAATIGAASRAAAEDLGHDKVDAEVCRALWDKLIPGITDRFDGPSMLRLFAGRPLLILNGETDPNCPIEGAELAFDAARKAYAAAGAEEKLKILVAKGSGHTVTDEQHRAAVEWLVRWLKPE